MSLALLQNLSYPINAVLHTYYSSPNTHLARLKSQINYLVLDSLQLRVVQRCTGIRCLPVVVKLQFLSSKDQSLNSFHHCHNKNSNSEHRYKQIKIGYQILKYYILDNLESSDLMSNTVLLIFWPPDVLQKWG